ncbi:LysR family transcriptional regulator [Comamonas endophytica]|uniref:LysR family transcriptional regulator n=2 Tax=Comamonas endophytica TaxID=2949090 RepID=A0ABY6GGM9_9BURK|nr:LysR family transcriptional regulator [Acidovorax sp. 5MLIR]MCD2513165.1 LysR family transcriptional regulator [Acidovorax sp. D4N7]UYG53485.1 LysR family transcriptional regulator [Acidovorax sp. 5MLIR]
MNLTFFSTLNAVIRRGSFAAAAADCNLSPSAVSLQMKRLEEHFGQLLFDRSGAHVVPTPFAHEVVGLINHTIDGLEALRKRSSLVIDGTLSIGVIESMQSLLLPEAMRYLRQRYPGLRLRPVRDKSAALLHALKEGALDAVVVGQPTDAQSKRLVWHSLLREPLVMVAPPNSTETTAAALFQNHDFIHFDRNTNLGIAVAKYIAKQRIQPKNIIELQSTQALLAMVSAGLGVSMMFCPDRRLTIGFPVRELKLATNASSLHISYVTRKADEDKRALAVTLEAFRHAAALRESGLA